MYRIAVVGEKDSIYGFAALGLETFFVEDPQEAKTVVKRLINDDVAIIYLTESIIVDIYIDLLKITKDKLISIIPIPSTFSDTKIGMDNLRNVVVKAVGTDILFS